MNKLKMKYTLLHKTKLPKNKYEFCPLTNSLMA